MRALIPCLLLLLATPVRAAVLESAPAGFTVENTVEVQASPREAWQALVDEVDAWWPKDHSWWGAQGRFSITARAGGCFCEKASGGRQAEHLRVSFVDPGRSLRMLGGLGPLQGLGLHGALEFRFAEAGEGRTRITLWYRVGGHAPDDLSTFAPVVDRVQAQQLGALARHLGADPAPAEER